MDKYEVLLQGILEELGRANEYHKQMVDLKRLQLIAEGKMEAEG